KAHIASACKETPCEHKHFICRFRRGGGSPIVGESLILRIFTAAIVPHFLRNRQEVAARGSHSPRVKRVSPPRCRVRTYGQPAAGNEDLHRRRSQRDVAAGPGHCAGSNDTIPGRYRSAS